MEVFELADVSKITKIPKTRVQNWSVGRPLRIIPSIRGGRGQGSRNLYSRTDIYRIALAKELTFYLDSKVIQHVVEEADKRIPQYPFSGELQWLLIKQRKKKLIKCDWLGPYENLEQQSLSDYINSNEMSLGLFVLNLAILFKQIDKKIEELRIAFE